VSDVSKSVSHILKFLEVLLNREQNAEV
jgi:hypothetical protein